MGSAGYAALMAIKRSRTKNEIVIVDDKEYDLMHPCGLPYALEGRVEQTGLRQDLNLHRMNVAKVRGRLSGIDTEKKTIVVTQENGERSIAYDRLVIATGSSPVIPPIKGVQDFMGRGLFTLSTLADLHGIMSSTVSCDHAVVIGAGAIGLETAYALKTRLTRVTVLEMQDQVLPGVLDPETASLCEQYFARSGIEIRTGTTAREAVGQDVFSGIITDYDTIQARIGILAAGFRPNCAYADASGLAVTPHGIRVNEKMETSRQAVYAAGDCIAGWSVIDGTELPAKLATSAYKQGTVAGINASGGSACYKGSSATFVSRIGDLEIAGTGYTTEIARSKGFEPVSGKITSGILPEYFPENPDITIKVVFDKNSGRILGAQAVGETGTAARINIISMAIEFNIPVHEIGRTELAYCPAVSEVYDPLLRAVDFGLRRIK